jgi:hypothetical protein
MTTQDNNTNAFIYIYTWSGPSGVAGCNVNRPDGRRQPKQYGPPPLGRVPGRFNSTDCFQQLPSARTTVRSGDNASFASEANCIELARGRKRRPDRRPQYRPFGLLDGLRLHHTHICSNRSLRSNERRAAYMRTVMNSRESLDDNNLHTSRLGRNIIRSDCLSKGYGCVEMAACLGTEHRDKVRATNHHLSSLFDEIWTRPIDTK